MGKGRNETTWTASPADAGRMDATTKMKGKNMEAAQSMIPERVIIRENSLIAKLAAKKLKSKNAALVLGQTIHLYGITRQAFLTDKKFVRHELQHVAQYREHGYLGFLSKYFWEWILKGYHNNRFEIEARNAEDEEPEEWIADQNGFNQSMGTL